MQFYTYRNAPFEKNHKRELLFLQMQAASAVISVRQPPEQFHFHPSAG